MTYYITTIIIKNKKNDILTRTVSFVFRFYLLIHTLIKDRTVVFARMKTVIVSMLSYYYKGFHGGTRYVHRFVFLKKNTVTSNIRHSTNLNYLQNSCRESLYYIKFIFVLYIYICCKMVILCITPRIIWFPSGNPFKYPKYTFNNLIIILN